ncbi:hypothetical protein N2152v2_009643 [Parachlorella kessleri]
MLVGGAAATACEGCGALQPERSMLICETCESGWHCGCLDPPLAALPPDGWQCPPCSAAAGHTTAGAAANSAQVAAAQPPPLQQVGQGATAAAAGPLPDPQASQPAGASSQSRWRPDIWVGGSVLRWVEKFKYLGSHFTHNIDLNTELGYRRSLGAAVFWRLWGPFFSQRCIKLHTRLTVFKVLVLSVVLYGCESLALTCAQQHRLDVFVKGCMRRMLGLRWRDHISDEELYRRCGQEDKPFDSVVVHWRRRSLRFLGHLGRMPESHLAKCILWATLPEGVGRRGRLANPLLPQVYEEHLKQLDLSGARRQQQDKMNAGGGSRGALYVSAVSLLGLTLGTWQRFPRSLTYLLEPAFVRTGGYNASLFLMVPNASDPGAIAVAGQMNSYLQNFQLDQIATELPTVTATGVANVLMASSEAINRELYCGYPQARCDGVQQLAQYAQAYDWGDSSPDGKFDVTMWYNATNRYGGSSGGPPDLVRVNQGMNLAANAYLRWALGSNMSTTLVGLMDFPRVSSRLKVDFGILLGPLFLTWLCQLLLPLMLVTLVYEKERRLRTMMKMHGLGDAAYWGIQYTYFLFLSLVYTWVLIGFGSAINLSFFRRTDYSFQLVFYFLWNNCLIGFAFLLSTLFRSSRTAVVVTFLYVFATGLLGFLMVEQFISQDHWWLVFIELIPGFGLYRGLFEIAQYSFRGVYQSSVGLTWSKLDDPANGIVTVMIIFAVEWALFLLFAWYLEQVTNTGVGVARHPLFFLGKRFAPGRKRATSRKGARVEVSAVSSGLAEGSQPKGADNSAQHLSVDVEGEDVGRERDRVAAALGAKTESSFKATTASSTGSGGGGSSSAGLELDESYATGNSIVVQELWKVFPRAGGNKEKAAVRGLNLVINRGECFGLLGPNGAGKSTTINLLTGFLEPSAGTAWVEGHDIRNEMPAIYSLMGVCPQDNLLWDTLTPREHLLFYGRLKGLKGAELDAAVSAGLGSVNLFRGGVSNKQVSTFSGGMKRRLSVAIALIGSPAVVYLDEPSTGLDPASRHNLWGVVKEAKRGRGIILTTHSMEEATVLCDRLGIFVNGQLVFTITMADAHVGEVEVLARGLAPGARLTYAVGSTRKYELPMDQVTLAGVFDAMEDATKRLSVLDWAIANATLEEVFIKFAKSIGAEGGE